MRVTIDLMKKSTQIIDLSNVINPRVGDDDLLLPLHIIYGDNQTDMWGKDVEFLSNDTNGNRIYVAGTCNTNTPGDNLYMGDLTFRFPAGTFKADGTYDPDKTMFRIVDKETQKVISSVNVKITVMKNAIEFNFDPDKSSYDSRLETMLHDFHDKGQAMLDEIKGLNNQAKSNVSGDTATTAKEAKKQADQNAGDISDIQGEVAGARGRFADMAGREDAQDIAINQKESINNANANYAVLKQKDAQQDTAIAEKANQSFIIDYLSKMYLSPEAFINADELKAKYPSGKPGIMVTTDTGHKWIWFNNHWTDCGIYQSVGIADDSVNSEMVKNINFNKVRDDLIEWSKIQIWSKASKVTFGDEYFTLTANNGDAGAIVPFDVPSTKDLVYLNISFEVLDGDGLTSGLDTHTMKDGEVTKTLQTLPLSTTGYSKAQVPVDYTRQTNQILVSIHGTGTVKVKLSINRSGKVNNLEQLSTKVGALSKINDDKYVNIFNGTLVPFGSAKVIHDQNGYQINTIASNDGGATDWFTTDAKQVLVRICGTKTFKTLQVSLGYLDSNDDKKVKFPSLLVSNENQFDLTVRFNPSDCPDATKFRLVIQCTDQDAGGTMTLTRFEIVPLDDLQVDANYDKNLREMIRKMLIAEGKMNQISAIYDADYTNLWNGVLTKFGSPQIDKIGSEYLITVTKPNDGGISPQYQSSSVKTKVHVEGSFSTQSVDIQVAYQTPNGQKYMKIGHVEGGTLNNDFYFDAVNLAVYQQASSFRTLIQCNDYNPKGVISITSLEEYELSGFQENPIYDRSMQKMMMNIINKIDSIAGTVNTMQADKGLYLTNAQGQKLQLVLNADGTVSAKSPSLNKVLFLGNSLLLGLDTNNESGGPFGMCASDSKHDYAHYVEEGIQAKNSNATFAKLHDAPFEQAATDEAAQNYIIDNNDKFKNQDLVIIQIGDNVDQNNLARFKQYLPKLVQQIKSDSPNVKIMLVGVWFDHDGLADYLKQLAQDQGCLYVAISALYNYENRASVGGTITFNNGSTMTIPAKYASHPGDKGHKAIADAILSQLNL